MSLENFQEERLKLMEEIFDLFDSENIGYVEIKDSLKILAAIGKKLDIEEENDFLTLVDPKNEGRVTKENFIRGVEEFFTVPPDFLREVELALKFFDRNNEGKVSCKELKNLLVRNSNEYKEEDVDELFKMLGLDIDGYIYIKSFLNEWKFQ